MKNIALTLSALAVSAAMAGSAAAQTATGPVTSLPPGLQGLVGGAGGVGAGAVITATILGTLLIVTVVNAARERALVQDGDVVVITAGVPLGGAGLTNTLKVHRVGEDKGWR